MSSRISTLALAAALAACGCDEGNGDGETDGVALADTVVEAPGDTGDGFGDASHAIDGVHGAGAQEGNADDVFSLGYETGENDYIILSWSGRRVANGAGARPPLLRHGKSTLCCRRRNIMKAFLPLWESPLSWSGTVRAIP